MKNRPSEHSKDRIEPNSAPSLHPGEIIIYAMISLIMVVGVISAYFAPDFLEDYYLVEDGILEWFTVVVLLLLAAVCARRAMRLSSVRPRMFSISLTILAFMFVFVAGEELSWGQRIFSLETPEWLEERNQQGELNIHNFVAGDFSVNKVVFGQLLTLALFLYMFLLPWLSVRSPRIGSLVEQLGLPIPRAGQALAFFPVVFIPDLLVDSAQTDEMMEVCGVLMLAAIFLFPKNGYLFSPDVDMRGA